MAKLNVDIQVTGEEKLIKLEESIDRIEKRLVNADRAIIGFSTALGGLALAFQAVNERAEEWEKKLTEIGDATETMTYRQDEASNAVDQLSHSLINSIKATDLYKNAVDLVTETIDGWSSIITGKTVKAIKEERDAVLEAIEAKKIETQTRKENEKALKAEANAIKKQEEYYRQGLLALSVYNSAQNKKVEAHKEEIAVLTELLQIYEEKGKDTTELIEKIEKMEQVDVLHIKTTREKAEALAELEDTQKSATRATQEYTIAVEDNTEATNENIQAKETMSATERNRPTLGGGGRGEQTGLYTSQKQTSRYEEAIIRELKKLNNQVGS